MVKINGKNLDIAGKSVSDYLNLAGYDLMRVAVELNGDIVPKWRYAETVFNEDDSVEVVSFVGGG